MKMFRKEEGFTLVELMVVVLIIGILVAVAIPVFNTAKANAQKKSCFANQRTLDGQARAYQGETGSLPADIAAMVAANYIKKAPTCPADKSAYTWTAASGEAACAAGADASLGTPHPRYDAP